VTFCLDRQSAGVQGLVPAWASTYTALSSFIFSFTELPILIRPANLLRISYGKGLDKLRPVDVNGDEGPNDWKDHEMMSGIEFHFNGCEVLWRSSHSTSIGGPPRRGHAPIGMVKFDLSLPN